jgi:thiamine pyrophosphokinase
MKDCVLFLHGTYRAADLPFYRKLCTGKFRVAVDGGYVFFKKTGLRPDLLIGDFDSLGRMPTNLPPSTEVLTLPCDKDATDSEAALAYCLERKTHKVDIVQPSIGELDHLLGNLMLLTRVGKTRKTRSKPKLRLINPSTEVRLIDSEGWTFSGAKGDTLSIVPLSKRVILSCRGTEYDVENLIVRRGETTGLRNRILTVRARIDIQGQAFVFHRFGGR